MAQPEIRDFNEIFDEVLGKLKTETSATETLVGKVALRALALVIAGASKLFYLKIARTQRNTSIVTADPASKGGSLDELGEVKLDRPIFQATNGEYTIRATGSEGGTVKTTDQLLSGSSSENPNYLFEPKEEKVILPGDSFVDVPVRSITPGIESKVSVNDELKFTNPITDIDQTAIVQTVDVAPVDGETIEQYRAEAIEAEQLEGQGGNPADYRTWEKDVAGVRKAYPIVDTPGNIVSYLEALETSSTDGNGTPPQSMIDEVAEAYEFDPDFTKPLNTRGRRPLGVTNVTVESIIPAPVVVTIVGLTDQSDETIESISVSLKALMYDVRPFIVGADDPNNRNDTLYESLIGTTVSRAIPSGEYFTSVTMTVNVGTVETYKFLNGEIPYLDSVVYT